jgi:hypothetical protein
MKKLVVKRISIIVGLLVVAVASAIIWARFSAPPGPVACTQEAKLYPDGTYVGRTGPNCNFTERPPISTTTDSGTSQISTQDWLTARNANLGISFRYSDKLPTPYIRAVDWLPQAALQDASFACAQAGSES